MKHMDQSPQTAGSSGGARETPRVGLFVTCLANLFRPSAALAAVQLLEAAGCTVDAPRAQTCCGQPALNSGDFDDVRRIARRMIDVFEGYDYVVAPSGSCIRTLRHDYPDLLANDPAWKPRAERLAARAHELTSFLTDVLGWAGPEHVAVPDCTLTYHDTCSGLRGLGIKAQPRVLLSRVEGVALKEMKDAEVCCGFGGTFCVKYPEISTKIVSDKTANVAASGATVLAGGDLGCLMNIGGRLKREGSPVRVYHVAEVLTGMNVEPICGEGE
ncbi:Lactate utilization protein A [Burkholderia oklahomensis]|nr:Lactate utilization protein A [Burkholderia oklahomensis]